MLRYVIKRLIYMIPTLFGMSIIAFLIIQLPPGDYLTSMLASMADSRQSTSNEAQIARYREIYGLDDPCCVQYWKWISGIIFRGDFGYSFEWKRPVCGPDLGAHGLDAVGLRRSRCSSSGPCRCRSASTPRCAATRSATTSSPSSASSASRSPTSSSR